MDLLNLLIFFVYLNLFCYEKIFWYLNWNYYGYYGKIFLVGCWEIRVKLEEWENKFEIKV